MTPASKLSLGLLLTACAGFIDAIGFIELGGFYTSFMSGNTTQLGADIGRGLPAALLPASLVAMFFAGSFAGSFLALSSARWGAVLTHALVVATLALSIWLATSGFSSAQTMIVLAIAAGAQNAAMRSAGAVRLGATFVTGTLFAAGQDLALALRRLAPPWRWLQHLMVWAALLVGAAIGAVGYAQAQVSALLAPMAIYALFLATTTITATFGKQAP